MSGFYNTFYSSTYTKLPAQMIPLKDKFAKRKGDQRTWGEACMDALESVGKEQYLQNMRLVENYEMLRGKFIYQHYFDVEKGASPLDVLAAQMELPNSLRHYDIISQVVNTMSGEWQKRPDLFKVIQLGDGASNEYTRTKEELTKKYAYGKIEAEINRKLAEQGFDITRDDFETEEDAQAYFEKIEAAKQNLSPRNIQKHMDNDFLTIGEKWANHQKEVDKKYFNLPEKEMVEFEDMLSADRAFRHFYLTPTYYNQETWNPINTFYHKSPDVTYIEDGDFVGRIFYTTLSTVIDRYGHRMNKEDLNDLKDSYEEENKKKEGEYDWIYNKYLVPFAGYPEYSLTEHLGIHRPHEAGIPQLNPSNLNEIMGNGTSMFGDSHFMCVVEGYWKSQEKLYKITYVDEETGDIAIDIVDENFVIPKHMVESKKAFADDHEINTYVETWVNRVWKGVKISGGKSRKNGHAIYIDIKPNDFQFKGDMNIYGAKLPVCGQVFNNRNGSSMSLVDLMKPDQIGHNVAMNQLYQLQEKEIGMFVVMDVNLFPNSKDWGGEDAWGKWMMMAKHMGFLPADTSPQNIQNALAASGGFLPKIIDLNLAGQMVSRMEIAKFYEQRALKQVGFNEYRTGSFSQSATATGVQQGVQTSYAQTESYFTRFSNYIRRCLSMSLDIAQYVQSQKESVELMYLKDDIKRSFIKIIGTDLLLSEFGVVVSNDQENNRKLEMMRQFALENNTAGMTAEDAMEIIVSNSPSEIMTKMRQSSDALRMQQEAAQLAEQQAQQAALEEQKRQADLENKQFYDKLDHELDVERIRAGAKVISEEFQLDAPEENKEEFYHQVGIDAQNASLKEREFEHGKQKDNAQLQLAQQKLAQEKYRTDAEIAIQNKETETARILKNKEKKA